MKQKNLQKGFTLIEMIVVLILVGILSAIAGMGIVTLMQGYLFSKDNAAVSAKANLALARINRELLECHTCNSAITLPYSFSTALGQRSIQFSNGEIQLSSDGTNYDTLLDKVSAFNMTYSNTDKSITVTINSSTKPGGVTIPAFTTKVYPRNT